MSDSMFKHLCELFEKEIKSRTEDLADGSAKDFYEYRYMIGMLRGLWLAHSIVANVAERYEEVE